MCPTSGRAVLCSKLVDGKCQAQSPIMLVDLAVRSYLQNSHKYGLGSLRETPKEGTPPAGPGPISGQLALILQLNPNRF